ncbi:hypothetical protein, partial [Paraburkholderia aspalathi]|uniref:hypothetical protein n=1 Tax=Paraburkholderia aspalathi TaxID=1324617 RepID=UPI001BA646E9
FGNRQDAADAVRSFDFLKIPFAGVQDCLTTTVPPRTGKSTKNDCWPRKALSAKVLLDMDGCKQNLSICVQDNRRTIFARFSRGPDNGPQTACDFGAFI